VKREGGHPPRWSTFSPDGTQIYGVGPGMWLSSILVHNCDLPRDGRFTQRNGELRRDGAADEALEAQRRFGSWAEHFGRLCRDQGPTEVGRGLRRLVPTCSEWLNPSGRPVPRGAVGFP
jgi:hypothetical protein